MGKTDSASQRIISVKEDKMGVMKWLEEKGENSGNEDGTSRVIEIYIAKTDNCGCALQKLSSRSTVRAIRRSLSSVYGAPIICRLVGRPFVSKPIGRLTAGKPR